MKNVTERKELERLIKKGIIEIIEITIFEDIEGEQLINLYYQIEDNSIWTEITGMAYSGEADEVEGLGQLIVNYENGILSVNTDNIRF